jgi:hypothetical protein
VKAETVFESVPVFILWNLGEGRYIQMTKLRQVKIIMIIVKTITISIALPLFS